MSEKHLSRKPHKIRGNKNAWWYEATNGIEVVVYRDAINQGIGSVIVPVPWKQIRAALARLDRK